MLLPYPVKIFATRGSDSLASEICQALQPRLPKEIQPDGNLILGNVEIEIFSNDNILVRVENVRGHLVVIMHTQVPPVDKGIIELFHLIDAINNARPADILLVFPYMPYARSDRKNQPRISTFGYTLPHILTTSFGIKRVILLDPHDSHIKHYFMPAADEITAIYLLIDYLEREVFSSVPKSESVIVFSDAGAAKRYGQITELLGLPEAYISKVRTDNSERPVIKGVVGEVRGKICFLIDDEILTGHTAIEDAQTLKDLGANRIFMLAIHAIFSHKTLPTSKVIQNLEESPIERFIVTDSVPVRHKLTTGETKITVLSVVNLLAEAIKRSIVGESLTALHQPENVSLYR